MPDQPPGFIIDANVLIDYADSDPSILTLFSKSIGTIHIIPDVFEKVEQLNVKECCRLGLVIAEPTLDQYLEAGKKIPGLAFDDTLCLILARDHHWTLISNDKALRSTCSGASIPLLWGLQIMLLLVKNKYLPSAIAQKISACIHALNPKFVHQQILERFIKKIGELKPKAQRKKIIK